MGPNGSAYRSVGHYGEVANVLHTATALKYGYASLPKIAAWEGIQKAQQQTPLCSL